MLKPSTSEMTGCEKSFMQTGEWLKEKFQNSKSLKREVDLKLRARLLAELHESRSNN